MSIRLPDMAHAASESRFRRVRRRAMPMPGLPFTGDTEKRFPFTMTRTRNSCNTPPSRDTANSAGQPRGISTAPF
jgi:hypothetical protein